MNSDFKELLKAFNAKNVDVWIETSDRNAANVFGALAAFGAPLKGLSHHDFARSGFFYQLGVPPARVDILMSIDGVAFSDAWPHRVSSELGGEAAWFTGRSDLLKNKLASGRHIDLHDAELLAKPTPLKKRIVKRPRKQLPRPKRF
jgi:hypothetical protein